MLKTTPHPVLQPPSTHFIAYDQNGSPISISPPPPTTTYLTSPHRRSRPAADLPPLLTETFHKSLSKPTTFLPLLKPPRDRAPSPKRVSQKETAEFDFESTLTGDPPAQVKLETRTGGLASWFNGNSDPVVFSVLPSPTREEPEPLFDHPTMTQASPVESRTWSSLTTRPSEQRAVRPAPPVALPSTTTVSKFKLGSLFRSRTSAVSGVASTDELMNLNIEEALFPSGRSDEPSSAALQCLEINAETTIRRFQRAYEENMQTTRAAISEKNVQADELEAAQTRNEHLKMQLSDMTERAREQEAAITALREELRAEKRRSWEDAEARRRSIRVVTRDTSATTDADTQTPVRRNRFSGASSLLESEAGSDLSSADSVFSDALPRESPMTSPSTSPLTKHTSTFGPTSIPGRSQGDVPIEYQVLSCQKCHGVSRSEAWDVISMMKVESRALKDRVEELEGARRDALKMIDGIMLA